MLHLVTHHFCVNIDLWELEVCEEELGGDEEVGGDGLVILAQVVACLPCQVTELAPDHPKQPPKQEIRVDSHLGQHLLSQLCHVVVPRLLNL